VRGVINTVSARQDYCAIQTPDGRLICVRPEFIELAAAARAKKKERGE
jgi:hypothetical protein